VTPATGSAVLTVAERALLRLSPGDPLPTGTTLTARYCTGTGTARGHTDALAPFFAEHFDVRLHPGSFNLWLAGRISLDSPLSCGHGYCCPIILADRAIGIVYRENEAEPALLEVLSPVQLHERLQVQPYDSVRVTLLAGTYFAPGRSASQARG
jgi:hypothetical protein